MQVPKLKGDYVELFKRGYFLGHTIMVYKDSIERIFAFHEVATVLDYGCGKAQPYRQGLLSWAKNTQLYDPFVAEYSHLPPETKKFDAVICSDVVEHVPEEELDDLLTKIFDRALKCVVLSFCNRPAKKWLPITNGNVHVTLHDKQWWEGKLEKHNKNKIAVYLFENE